MHHNCHNSFGLHNTITIKNIIILRQALAYACTSILNIKSASAVTTVSYLAFMKASVMIIVIYFFIQLLPEKA